MAIVIVDCRETTFRWAVIVYIHHVHAIMHMAFLAYLVIRDGRLDRDHGSEGCRPQGSV